MDDTPYALNLREIGVEANKDLNGNQVFSLYRVHRAGATHGHGLFAKRFIDKDEEVIRATGPIIGPHIAATLYWSYGIDILVQAGLDSWIMPNNEARFINHSCEPNLGFGEAGVFVALRNIRPGEELTYDYSTSDIDPDWAIDCQCGTKSCRKRISGLDIFDKKLKLYKKYQGYLPLFVVEELKKRKLD